MSYIRLSDLAGLGQSAEDFDKTAIGLDAQAESLELQARAMASSQPGVAQGFTQQAQAFRQNAALMRQKAVAARTDSSASSAAVASIASSLLNTGAIVGGSFLQSEAARKAAKAANKNQPGLSPTFVLPPAEQPKSNTGLVVGVVVGGVAVLGVLTYALTRKKDD